MTTARFTVTSREHDDAPATRGKIGVVVPPANPVAEPELAHLLAAFGDVHTTRLPVLAEPLEQRLQAYNQVVPDMIRSFGRLSLDAVVVACSGSRYLLGPQRDQADAAALSDAHQVPIAPATVATLTLLRQLDVHDLVLVSPYEPWLSEQARRYWRAADVHVRLVSIQTSASTYAPYEVSGLALVEQIAAADLDGDAVVLCTGTGMSTLGVLSLLGAGNNRVLLTSNLAMAWWALRQVPQAVQPYALPWALRRLSEQGASL